MPDTFKPHLQRSRWRESTERLFWSVFRVWLILFALVVLASTAPAAIVGVTDCNCTNLTIKLSDFPNFPAATVTAKLNGVIVEGTFYYGTQKIVLTRPAGLAGGNYLLEIFQNNALAFKREITVCDCAILPDARGIAFERAIRRNNAASIAEGRQTFRYATFGDEAFWGDALKLHLALAGTNHGGTGPGVSPRTALSVGLKVDLDALPIPLRAKLRAGQVNLDDPAVTLALLKLNSVVGVTGFFDKAGQIQSMGIQCALCHSTVDDSLAPGIGRRLDGWPNRDLNVGAIIALAPDLSPVAAVLQVDENTVRSVITQWGPGKFDAELLLDGKGFRPDGKTAATLIPPAYGLAGVNLHTWTGWGSITHWNAFVAVLEMHGKGRFFDPRLNDANQFPVAARNGFGDVQIAADEDQVTAKLPALQVYQLSLPAPKPQPGKDFNSAAAKRGDALFSGKANCNRCHSEPLWTEPGWNLHTPAEIGIDDFQANRAPDRRYRTAPLAGIFSRPKGGFFHDGRFATLLEVVEHYNSTFSLTLTDAEKADLVEYIKSL